MQTVAIEQGREVYAGVQGYRRKSRKGTKELEQKPVLKNIKLHIISVKEDNRTSVFYRYNAIFC